MYTKKEKLYPAYVSKHNSNRERQVILLMIPSGETREPKSEGRKVKSERQQWWHYLAVKNLLPLLRGITSNNNLWFLLFELSPFH